MEVIEISSDEETRPSGPASLNLLQGRPQPLMPLQVTDRGQSASNGPLLMDAKVTPRLPEPFPRNPKNNVEENEGSHNSKSYPGVELNGNPSSLCPLPSNIYRETQDDLVSYEEYFYSTEPGCFVKDVTRIPDANAKIPCFKCDICSKVVTGNIRFMDHVEGHFFSSMCLKGSADLLDLCRYCLRRFSTPHEMQLHVVHAHFGFVSDSCQCRICEQTFEDEYIFAFHLRECHPPRDMPYVCQACRFRTSSYADFADHFVREHSNTSLLYCMYCLMLYRLREVNARQSLYYSASYIRHVRNHYTQVSNNTTRPCSKCRLTFNSAEEQKSHEMKSHKGKPFKQEVREDKLHGSRKINMKSLHLLRMPERLDQMKCLECSRSMALSLHYRSFRQCSRLACGYATCCHFNYKSHCEFAHRPLEIAAAVGWNYRGRPPRDRPLPVYMQCDCGHRDVYGDSMAKHLVECPFTDNRRVRLVSREPHRKKVNLKKYTLVEPQSELLTYMKLRRLMPRLAYTAPT